MIRLARHLFAAAFASPAKPLPDYARDEAAWLDWFEQLPDALQVRAASRLRDAAFGYDEPVPYAPTDSATRSRSASPLHIWRTTTDERIASWLGGAW